MLFLTLKKIDNLPKTADFFNEYHGFYKDKTCILT